MKIVFTPDWFLNNDLLIEVVSFFVLITFFFLAIKGYKINKKKSLLYLGVGFLLVALGELATILTKIVLYYDTTITREIGQTIITYQVVKTVDIFYNIGFFFQKILTLLGFYLIYKIPSKKIVSGDSLLVFNLIVIVALLGSAWYFTYHITALLIIFLIINNYYKTYVKEKISNQKILIAAFGLLALSQIIFLFSQIDYFYVIAQSMQLISYITLFALVVKILKNGKKT
ncbi:hypothetical protein COU59_01210 [Candidatus Pacearchaeota archaeon CG10_big_fil_rev_8_21_14_0_10_34_12]|nr:MAG: hypothetical protein COU59_01210 [Candidatus Pacearchaeota archaeon CG10_big_fil_rev_8_21_14_0_10_34_12]